MKSNDRKEFCVNFFRAYSYYNRTGGNDDDERPINGHTAAHPATASELCINGFVACGRKITWGPGLRACKGPLVDTGTAWPYWKWRAVFRTGVFSFCETSRLFASEEVSYSLSALRIALHFAVALLHQVVSCVKNSPRPRRLFYRNHIAASSAHPADRCGGPRPATFLRR